MKTVIQILLYGVLCALAHGSRAADREQSAENKTGSDHGGGVVKSLNGLDGKINLRAGDNITIVPSRNGLTISTDGATACGGDSNAWHRTGDIVAPGDFLGTLNDQPLEFKVNGQRALRLEYGGLSDRFGDDTPTGAHNVVGGASGNFVRPGTVGAFIGGGGATNYLSSVEGKTNSVGSDFGTLAGGIGNRISQNAWSSAIGGGHYNTIDYGGSLSTISGGDHNSVRAEHVTISGGSGNFVQEDAKGSTVAGGQGNSIRTNAQYSVVSGGAANFIERADHSAVAGGYYNRIQSYDGYSTIGGGRENEIQGGAYATIAGGMYNQIYGSSGASIGGGYNNGVTEENSCIGGGSQNSVFSPYAGIAAGLLNLIGGGSDGATISGGWDNRIEGNGKGSTIAGGKQNRSGLSAEYAAIGGGLQNTNGGPFAAIPGGVNNWAGTLGFAAGRRAKAIHQGAFVWADSTDADVSSASDNQFVARASGGVVFFSSAALTSGVFLSPGGGSWSTLSDRNAKENVEPVNGRTVLDKLCAMPLAAWNYKTQDRSIRHIGPMAQDFHAAFGVGEDEKHIATVDADGVALAAIQGLNDLVREKDVRISELEKRLARLERIVAQSQSR